MSYSPPKYPTSIPDQVTDLPDRTDDIDWIEAWIYNYVKKELVAVMTELGTDPAGTEATVAARLTAIEASGVDESVIMNIYLNSFRIAILGSYAVMNMAKGISDEYEDETGIDTGTSTNEDYDSANDLYSPTATYGSDEIPEMTSNTAPSGVASADSELTGQSAYAYKAFNDSNSGDWACWHTLNEAFPHYLKYEFTATKIIQRYTIAARDNAADINYPAAWTLQGSNNDSDWDTLDTQTGQSFTQAEKKTYDFFNSTAYLYYKLVVTSGGAAQYLCIGEFELIEKPSDLMTLVSEKFTADAAPDDARIIIFEEDVDAITVNTDIKAYVSRDDGANYTQVTLTDEGDYSGSKRILSGEVDISGQPEDTDMIYKIETLNNKDLKLHGIGLSWA